MMWHQWIGMTKLPSSTASCSADGYPAYVITATSTADVQTGLNFSASTSVRLLVKGTGHNYQSR